MKNKLFILLGCFLLLSTAAMAAGPAIPVKSVINPVHGTLYVVNNGASDSKTGATIECYSYAPGSWTKAEGKTLNLPDGDPSNPASFGGKCYGIAVSPDGTLLFVSVNQGANSHLRIYTLTNGLPQNPSSFLSRTWGADTNSSPMGISVNGSGTRIYMADPGNQILRVFHYSSGNPSWNWNYSPHASKTDARFSNLFDVVVWSNPSDLTYDSLYFSEKINPGKIFSTTYRTDNYDSQQHDWEPPSFINELITNIPSPSHLKTYPDVYPCQLYSAINAGNSLDMYVIRTDQGTPAPFKKVFSNVAENFGWTAFDVARSGYLIFKTANNESETDNTLFRVPLSETGNNPTATAIKTGVIQSDSVIVALDRKAIALTDSRNGNLQVLDNTASQYFDVNHLPQTGYLKQYGLHSSLYNAYDSILPPPYEYIDHQYGTSYKSLDPEAKNTTAITSKISLDFQVKETDCDTVQKARVLYKRPADSTWQSFTYNKEDLFISPLGFNPDDGSFGSSVVVPLFPPPNNPPAIGKPATLGEGPWEWGVQVFDGTAWSETIYFNQGPSSGKMGPVNVDAADFEIDQFPSVPAKSVVNPVYGTLYAVNNGAPDSKTGATIECYSYANNTWTKAADKSLRLPDGDPNISTSVGGKCYGMAVSPDGTLLFISVNQWADSRLRVYHLTNGLPDNTPVTEINWGADVNSNPMGLTISYLGDVVYLANPGNKKIIAFAKIDNWAVPQYGILADDRFGSIFDITNRSYKYSQNSDYDYFGDELYISEKTTPGRIFKVNFTHPPGQSRYYAFGGPATVYKSNLSSPGSLKNYYDYTYDNSYSGKLFSTLSGATGKDLFVEFYDGTIKLSQEVTAGYQEVFGANAFDFRGDSLIFKKALNAEETNNNLYKIAFSTLKTQSYATLIKSGVIASDSMNIALDGKAAALTNSRDGSIQILDNSNGQLFPNSQYDYGLPVKSIINPVHGTLYAVNNGNLSPTSGATIDAYSYSAANNTWTKAEGKSIRLPDGTRGAKCSGLAASPDGTQLFVSVNQGSGSKLLIYELVNGVPTNSAPQEAGWGADDRSDPMEIAVNGTGIRLYMADPGNHILRVFEKTGTTWSYLSASSFDLPYYKEPDYGSSRTADFNNIFGVAVYSSVYSADQTSDYLYISERLPSGKLFGVGYNKIETRSQPSAFNILPYSSGQLLTAYSFPFPTSIKIGPPINQNTYNYSPYITVKGAMGEVVYAIGSYWSLTKISCIVPGAYGWNAFDIAKCANSSVIFKNAFNAEESSNYLYRYSVSAQTVTNVKSGIIASDGVSIAKNRRAVAITNSRDGSVQFLDNSLGQLFPPGSRPNKPTNLNQFALDGSSPLPRLDSGSPGLNCGYGKQYRSYDPEYVPENNPNYLTRKTVIKFNATDPDNDPIQFVRIGIEPYPYQSGGFRWVETYEASQFNSEGSQITLTFPKVNQNFPEGYWKWAVQTSDDGVNWSDSAYYMINGMTAVLDVDQTPPVITFKDPVNNATNVPVNKEPRLGVSTAYYSWGSFSFSCRDNNTGTDYTGLTANFQVVGNNVDIVLKHKSGFLFNPSTSYTLTVNSLTDEAGNDILCMGAEKPALNFATIDIPTAIFDPRDGSTNVAVNKPIKIDFSEPMKTGTFLYECVDQNGISYNNNLAVSWSNYNKTAILNHVNNSTFAASQKYVFTIKKAEDLDGNDITLWGEKGMQYQRTSFTIGNIILPPAILSVDPFEVYVGQTLIIKGTNLGADLNSVLVEVADIPVVPASVRQDEIILAIPPTLKIGRQRVTVTNSGGSAEEYIYLKQGAIVIDDFEGGNTGYSSYEGTELSGLTDESAYERDQNMKIKCAYIPPAKEWTAWILRWPAHEYDLSTMDTIRFYLKGDGSNNTFSLSLYSNKGDQSYTLTSPALSLNDTSYHTVTLKLNDFSISPNDGTTPSELLKKTGIYSFTYKGNSASNNYHYIDYIQAYDSKAICPIIYSAAPATGVYIGQTIVIKGNNFSNDYDKGINKVTVGGITGHPTRWSNEEIILAVPKGVNSGPEIIITNHNGYQSDPYPISVKFDKIMIDDFEGGAVDDNWFFDYDNDGSPDSGYYVFDKYDVSEFPPKETTSYPDKEKKGLFTDGSSKYSMQAWYSWGSRSTEENYVKDPANDWGGGWAGKLANTLDFSGVSRFKFYLKWDSSPNTLNLVFQDADGTEAKFEIPNENLQLNNDSLKSITIEKNNFRVDPLHPGLNFKMDWGSIVRYAFAYKTKYACENNHYHYVDSLQALQGSVKVTQTSIARDDGPDHSIIITWKTDPPDQPVDIYTLNGNYSFAARDWAPEFKRASCDSLKDQDEIHSGVPKHYKVIPAGNMLTDADVTPNSLNSPIVGKFDWEIVEGSNLVSLPFSPPSNDIRTIIGNQLYAGNSLYESDGIYQYNTEAQQWLYAGRQPDDTWAGTLGTIEPAKGYFITRRPGQGPTRVTVVGKFSPDSYSAYFYAGSNMLGIPFPVNFNMSNKNLINLLTPSGLPVSADIIYHYDAKTQAWQAAYLNAENKFSGLNLSFFEPGKGYYITNQTLPSEYAWETWQYSYRDR